MQAQIEKILEVGVVPTHFDSHEHIHWRLEFLPIFCTIAKQYHIDKMRREFNFGPISSFKNLIRRNIWLPYAKLHYTQFHCTDFFSNVNILYRALRNNEIPDNTTFEILCHPGRYKETMDLVYLLKKEFDSDKCQLISYHQL